MPLQIVVQCPTYFGLSLQARTGFDNDSIIVINSSTGQVTIGDGDMDAHTAATATIRIFDRGQGLYYTADKILSLQKLRKEQRVKMQKL